MSIQAVLFDLDDTLIVDEAVSKEAIKNTANHATELFGTNSLLFQASLTKIALALWKEGACHTYCRNIGISFHECLWGEFLGDAPELVSLRKWAQRYRVEAFDATLREQGIVDAEAARNLSQVFATSRRRLQRPMPNAKETVVRLKSLCKVALLTNGAPDLQREKIAASGLEAHFDGIAISGEHGIGKPRREIFELLLKKLEVPASCAVMVGNSLERDIAGAKNARLAASIWLRVAGSEEQADVIPDYTISGLHEIPVLVQSLNV